MLPAAGNGAGDVSVEFPPYGFKTRFPTNESLRRTGLSQELHQNPVSNWSDLFNSYMADGILSNKTSPFRC
jgi:hypothetical protein